MKKSVMDSHPDLNEEDVRFNKTVNSVVSSFQIEGIEFSSDELDEMISNVKEELKLKESKRS
ncbi:hypothetical protein [Carboxylicivirga caseinilyticus]|uniref:hypothetical protein n=1 Tax=Carboxylicivirga caseinilyticus TaxID=3417572 RepID=UPI003D34A731|nr:hypothetical protein [Marinilabiliaceae bacterium A049]